MRDYKQFVLELFHVTSPHVPHWPTSMYALWIRVIHVIGEYSRFLETDNLFSAMLPVSGSEGKPEPTLMSSLLLLRHMVGHIARPPLPFAHDLAAKIEDTIVCYIFPTLANVVKMFERPKKKNKLGKVIRGDMGDYSYMLIIHLRNMEVPDVMFYSLPFLFSRFLRRVHTTKDKQEVDDVKFHIFKDFCNRGLWKYLSFDVFSPLALKSLSELVRTVDATDMYTANWHSQDDLFTKILNGIVGKVMTLFHEVTAQGEPTSAVMGYFYDTLDTFMKLNFLFVAESVPALLAFLWSHAWAQDDIMPPSAHSFFINVVENSSRLRDMPGLMDTLLTALNMTKSAGPFFLSPELQGVLRRNLGLLPETLVAETWQRIIRVAPQFEPSADDAFSQERTIRFLRILALFVDSIGGIGYTKETMDKLHKLLTFTHNTMVRNIIDKIKEGPKTVMTGTLLSAALVLYLQLSILSFNMTPLTGASQVGGYSMYDQLYIANTVQFAEDAYASAMSPSLHVTLRELNLHRIRHLKTLVDNAMLSQFVTSLESDPKDTFHGSRKKRRMDPAMVDNTVANAPAHMGKIAAQLMSCFYTCEECAKETSIPKRWWESVSSAHNERTGQVASWMQVLHNFSMLAPIVHAAEGGRETILACLERTFTPCLCFARSSTPWVREMAPPGAAPFPSSGLSNGKWTTALYPGPSWLSVGAISASVVGNLAFYEVESVRLLFAPALLHAIVKEVTHALGETSEVNHDNHKRRRSHKGVAKQGGGASEVVDAVRSVYKSFDDARDTVPALPIHLFEGAVSVSSLKVGTAHVLGLLRLLELLPATYLPPSHAARCVLVAAILDMATDAVASSLACRRVLLVLLKAHRVCHSALTPAFMWMARSAARSAMNVRTDTDLACYTASQSIINALLTSAGHDAASWRMHADLQLAAVQCIESQLKGLTNEDPHHTTLLSVLWQGLVRGMESASAKQKMHDEVSKACTNVVHQLERALVARLQSSLGQQKTHITLEFAHVVASFSHLLQYAVLPHANQISAERTIHMNAILAKVLSICARALAFHIDTTQAPYRLVAKLLLLPFEAVARTMSSWRPAPSPYVYSAVAASLVHSMGVLSESPDLLAQVSAVFEAMVAELPVHELEVVACGLKDELATPRPRRVTAALQGLSVLVKAPNINLRAHARSMLARLAQVLAAGHPAHTALVTNLLKQVLMLPATRFELSESDSLITCVLQSLHTFVQPPGQLLACPVTKESPLSHHLSGASFQAAYWVLYPCIRHHSTAVARGITPFLLLLRRMMHALAVTPRATVRLDTMSPLTLEYAMMLGRLFSEMIPHVAHFGHYVPSLVAEYLSLVQLLPVPPSHSSGETFEAASDASVCLSPQMRTALQPGIFALLDMCTEDQRRHIFTTCDEGGRYLFQTLHDRHIALHSFSGKT
eukprot:TRINITY_DN2998_c0_g1_i4.p1 TRINITY_DN2998_c0_g1~~TRINITY_DN2998_c0_g1_i4.p1  ORF type:complete len:1613 (-),score=308.36 TRINITY_DN2998_c0_g1_i4:43-4323(-)